MKLTQAACLLLIDEPAGLCRPLQASRGRRSLPQSISSEYSDTVLLKLRVVTQTKCSPAPEGVLSSSSESRNTLLCTGTLREPTTCSVFRSEDVWTTGLWFGSDVHVPLRLICNLVLTFGTQRSNNSEVVSAPIINSQNPVGDEYVFEEERQKQVLSLNLCLKKSVLWRQLIYSF